MQSLVAEVQIGRYATVRALPTEAQHNVMETLILIRFDASVKTFGGVVAVNLEQVGHTLSDAATADSQRGPLTTQFHPA